jgi:hypothetical protein
MSQAIEAVIVWLGGVLVPGQRELATGIIKDLAGVKVNWPGIADINQQTEEWQLGDTRDREYLSGVMSACGVQLPPEQFAAAAGQRLQVNQEAMDVLAELPARYQRYLLVDYPPEWLQPSACKALAEQFPAKNQLVIRKSQAAHLVPGVLQWAAEIANVPLLECLFIDGDHKRAVQSVRNGASVCTYVSPWRMRREFVLRRMLPQAMPSHVPGQH